MVTRIIQAKQKSTGVVLDTLTLEDDTINEVHIPTAFPNLVPGELYAFDMSTPEVDYMIPAAASNHSAEINIVSRAATQTAPEAIMFDVTLNGFDAAAPAAGEVYDPQKHDVYFEWDFGDNYNYSVLSKTPTAFRDSRSGHGPVASHTYRQAGTYTVTCTIFEPDSSKGYVVTRSVSVGAPQSLFVQDAQTIVLDNTGAGLAEYPNATVVTSLLTAINTIKGYDNTSVPRRVVLRRGQTFVLPSLVSVGGNNWPTVHFVAADETGNDPVIQAMSGTLRWRNNDDISGRDLVIQNLYWLGGWDPQTEAGTYTNGLEVNSNPPEQYLLDGVTLQDFGGRAFQSTEADITANPLHLFLNDSQLDGWGFYGIFLASARYVSFTGCKVEQDPLANAGGPKDDAHNNHGPFRISRADSSSRIIAQSSEFFSRNDWSNALGIYSQQPCWRFDTSGIGGGFFSVHGSVLEGGATVIATGTQSNQGSDSRRINGLIAQNYILASHITRELISIEKSGVTVRNNVMTFPDTPHYPVWGPKQFLKVDWDGVVAGEQGAPIRAYNNTLINLSDVPVDMVGGNEAFTNTIVANNLFYQNNADPALLADGPLDQTPLFAPSERGYKHNISNGDGLHVLQTAYETNQSDVWTGSPLAGSEALGDVDENLPFAYNDFYGQVRPQIPSRGAFEMIEV